jgi:hippurate hydrolase
MLLGAAKYLAETRNFDGTAIMIFQPAEEGGGGGKEMVDDGMMERWNIQEVYGMHNWPGEELGTFAIRSGPFFAATDTFEIVVKGLGGHAAKPDVCIDPTVVSSHIVLALQSIVSRNVDPVKQAVVSVTSFETESKAFNVIPPAVTLKGTVRTLEGEVRDLIEARLIKLAEMTAQAYGANAGVSYIRGYPATVNHAVETEYAAGVAANISGNCNTDADLVMGGEDFSYMLESRPGAYILMGNGVGSAMVHHPEYNFNDEAIPTGCSYWAEMIESRMPVK